ncbi:hypothetical protein EIP91_005685 [Steccherinum ochraceum]|uniref:Uncharacterized protein n=1 Tax=Steccherinum ochraceum TaxID=92696 RepID=A0A4R0RLW6_9APHY|nr:hypothetical protein EIP91_005685 [Steccherinum ochraceum]
MGYVASRKFCCCLPVRFGVFCMAFLGLAAGGALGGLGWYEIHRYAIGEVAFDKREIVALYFVSIAFSVLALISLIGLIGGTFKVRGLVITYAYSVTVNTLILIGVGVFFVWTLFHRDHSDMVNTCADDANFGSNFARDYDPNFDSSYSPNFNTPTNFAAEPDATPVTHWFCQKGFDVIRILLTVAFVVIWIFQLAGIFIVFDYVGQLNEELDARLDEKAAKAARKAAKAPAPVIINNGEPQMRTTYEASGWTSAKSPYAFSMPENAHGARFADNRV